jgi:hypothetical protein
MPFHLHSRSTLATRSSSPHKKSDAFNETRRKGVFVLKTLVSDVRSRPAYKKAHNTLGCKQHDSDQYYALYDEADLSISGKEEV